MDEASSILQRLPYLGRVGSGSPNRRFVDDYAKSGLRGLALVEAFKKSDRVVAKDKYNRPLGEFGSKFLSSNGLIGKEAEKYVKYCNSHGNVQIAGDYLCSVIQCCEGELDFSGTPVMRAGIDKLDLSDIRVRGLNISNSYIEELVLQDTEFVSSVFQECIIPKITGVSDAAKLPEAFMPDCLLENFDPVDNVSRISELPLSDSQKTLIAIINKLFFQPGRGRMEEALLRGTVKYWDKKAAGEVISYMRSNSIINVVQGNRGDLYVPNRRFMRRMGQIRSLMANSNDDLWKIVS